MRAYLLDEISGFDMERVVGFLEARSIRSHLEAVFWVQVPEDLLSPLQFEHPQCRPYAFAIEVGSDFLKAEFFVRSLATLRCACLGYCTMEQQRFILAFIDGMIEELRIMT